MSQCAMVAWHDRGRGAGQMCLLGRQLHRVSWLGLVTREIIRTCVRSAAAAVG